MTFDFLGNELISSISKISIDKLYEIRLRKDFPIKINYDNKICYLSKNGVSLSRTSSIICSKNNIEKIINNVTENSLYAFNDRIKEGFLTTKEGIRIGISGECVFNGEKIITIKNITSLNIRIPHKIKDCSKEIYKYINDGNINNSLIISPPRYGKTTILKDLCLRFNSLNKNVLVIDERGEFSNISGENIDKICYCNKYYAFNYAVRTLSPDIVITDELSDKNAFLCALEAVNSGVKIIASCHGDSISSIREKPYFIGVFDRYFVLEAKDSAGILKEIFDKDFNLL